MSGVVGGWVVLDACGGKPKKVLTLREGFVFAAECLLCIFNGDGGECAANKDGGSSSVLVVLDKLVSNCVELLLAELEFEASLFVLLKPFRPPTTIGL